MVGGPGFDEFEFNVTTQKGRPTGSSFKTFVLAAAFELGGLIPSDSINATSPCSFDNPGSNPPVYNAGDYNGGRKSGLLTIQQHTLSSTNCGFLRLSQLVGLNNVVDTARSLGVTSTIEPVLALPLGVFDITPLEMDNAYATIANDGVRVEPFLIERVTQGLDEELVFEHDPKPFRAITPQSARLVTEILERNVNCSAGSCTGRRAQLAQHPAAGKTGTGQDNFDAWFVGYTPQLATAVWIGGQEGQISMRYDPNSPDFTRAQYVQAFGEFADAGVTGGSIPAALWGRFMNDYMASLPVVEFEDPEAGRRGERLRSDGNELESESAHITVISPCGGANAEVDQDGDGDVDWCRNLGGVAIGSGCPSLLVAVDTNGDGTNDRCVARIRPADAIDPNATTTTVPAPVEADADAEDGDADAGEGEDAPANGDDAEAGNEPADATDGETNDAPEAEAPTPTTAAPAAPAETPTPEQQEVQAAPAEEATEAAAAAPAAAPAPVEETAPAPAN